MKIIILVLIYMIAITNNSREDNWLKPNDYNRCEGATEDEISETGCPSRWNPTDYKAYGDYACCYVSYKKGEDREKGCYLIQNSKTGRKIYLQDQLTQYDEVSVICASSFIKNTFIIILVLMF